jgi:hypothetical protein
VKLANFRNRNLVKEKHEPGYAIVIKIHVLENGESRIVYTGDLRLGPLVLKKARKMLEEELEDRKDIITLDNKNFIVNGEKVNGVLCKTTITKED